ncbi:DUF3140 domain-containing protein [Maribacter sp. 2307ULW6-5]|uniref:DUF3140 domain-containing protein n=1 Tax=Maribacter sp. 2307ULW6-5 TaxID=3386275 RepID=UPI0039BCD109
MPTEKETIYQDFYDAVNMTPSELEDWLDTDKAKEVGQDSGDGESIGHKSGKRIIQIKKKKKEQLDQEDYDHMKKVVGYVNRHRAQGPEKDIKTSNWRYSLKNWGHDPCKKMACD